MIRIQQNKKVALETIDYQTNIINLDSSLTCLLKRGLDSSMEGFINLIIQQNGNDFTIEQFLAMNNYNLLEILSIGAGKLYLHKEIIDYLIKNNIIEDTKCHSGKISLSVENRLNSLIGIGIGTKANAFINLVLGHHGNNITIAKFLSMDTQALLRVDKIGKGKLYVFEIIKNHLIDNDIISEQDIKNSAPNWPDTEVLQDLQLNFSLLNDAEVKMVKKAIKQLDTDNPSFTLDKLLFEYTPEGTTKGVSFGKIYEDLLNRIQTELTNHLDKSGNIILESFVSGRLIRYCEPLEIPIAELDKQLSNDLTLFINSLSEQGIIIFKSRLALDGCLFNTLDQAGKQFNPEITRERVRQIEAGILEKLTFALTYIPNTIWSNIRESLIPDTKSIFPNLATRFTEEKDFMNFLSKITNTKLQDLEELILPKYKVKDLAPLFIDYKAPIDSEIVEEYIQDTYGYTGQQAKNTLLLMYQNREIVITADGITPLCLSKKIAMAQAALFYPNGIGFRELYKYINTNLLCGEKIPGHRQDHAIADAVEAGYIYQSGHGKYRHLAFLNLSEDTIESSLSIIKTKLKEFKTQGFESVNLNSGIHQPEQVTIDYYIFRHIAREYGGLKGIYFNGKSGADTVSLQEDFSLQGQAEAIIRLFEENPKARGTEEIKQILRSKSNNHASDLVDKLQKQYRLVRVAHSQYNIPKAAFKHAPINTIIDRVERILKKANRPVEITTIIKDCNTRFHLEYSKPWYISFLKFYSNLHSKNWFFYQSYVSCKEIDNLTIEKIIQKHFNPNLSNDYYVELVNQQILAKEKQIKTILNRVRNNQF
ncbi:MAG: hypothetical protein L3J53_08915 [Proteobacteria bacterium]|nr:hypothetical protein [Pseudomonadota bacterium]